MVYSGIQYNLKLRFKLYLIYQTIIGLLFIYCVIKNNYTFFLEFLEDFLRNYVYELSEDSIIFMDSLDEGYNYYGEGSSGNNPTGGKPSGNNTTGAESTMENENKKKRKRDNNKNKKPKKRKRTNTKKKGKKPVKRGSKATNSSKEPVEGPKLKYRKKPMGPSFSYFDKSKGKKVYPETFHTFDPSYYASNTTRVYEDGNIRYTYVCHAFHRKNRYCQITYPDGSKAIIFDKSRVMKHIEYHRKHI